MSDTAIQQLEREVRRTPHDATLRLRLAAALLRSGRERDALAAIDFAQLGPEHFAAAKELSERAWRERIARFEPALTSPPDAQSGPQLDRSGRIAVFRMPTYYEVTDVSSGELVERERGKIRRSCEAPGAVYFETVRRDAHELHWARTGAGGEIEMGEAELGSRSLVGVSPEGDRIFLADDRSRMMGAEARYYVADLPSLEVRHRGPWRGEGVPVWESERIVFADSVLAWRTGERTALPGSANMVPDVLGASVVSDKEGGIVRIHDVALGWTTRIPVVKHLSLSTDGRTLRASTRARAILFDLDRASGALEERSARSLKGVGLGAWHPSAEVLIPAVMGERRAITFQGEVIRDFPPGAMPYFWVADGAALLVMWHGGRSYEVWRERNSRGS
jgi:hypothetical protein